MLNLHKRFTLVELMIVTGVILIVISLAVPGLFRAKVSTQESGAVASLRAIASTQSVFRSSLLVDQDNDGIGEYGLFVELSGVHNCRTPSGQIVEPTLINKVFGVTSDRNGGLASKAGFAFLMYLPTVSGPAFSEEDMLSLGLPTPRSEPLNSDAQEVRFACYTWPTFAGNTGNKAFVVNHSGEIFFTQNETGPTTYRYSGNTIPNRPEAGAAFDAADPAGSSNLENQVIPSIPALDGLVWFPLNQ